METALTVVVGVLVVALFGAVCVGFAWRAWHVVYRPVLEWLKRRSRE
jgi:hypothetical protein